MGLKEKLEKIKESRVMKVFEIREDEKTGVLNGLLLLSAAVATLVSLQHTASGSGTACTDTINQKVTDTGNQAKDLTLDTSQWGNHCWWNHHAFGAGGNCFHFAPG